MRELFEKNKMAVVTILVIGLAATIFASTQTDLFNSVTGETNDHSGDAMEAGQAMQAQEDLGKESTEEGSMDSNDFMDANDSMNDSMAENGSMEQ